MKILIEIYGIEHSMTNLPDDADIDAMAEYLRQILMCAGYSQKSVNEILEAQWRT